MEEGTKVFQRQIKLLSELLNICCWHRQTKSLAWKRVTGAGRLKGYSKEGGAAVEGLVNIKFVNTYTKYGHV